MKPVADVAPTYTGRAVSSTSRKPGLDAREHRLELASAMAHHRARHLRENLGTDFGWARNEERPEFALEP